MTTMIPEDFPKYGEHSAQPANVVGVMYAGIAYLYDAPEFRPVYGSEVYERDGSYWLARNDATRMLLSWCANDEMIEANNLGRYWLGQVEDAEPSKVCPICHGDGETVQLGMWAQCEVCNGMGAIVDRFDNEVACLDCDGLGELQCDYDETIDMFLEGTR